MALLGVCWLGLRPSLQKTIQFSPPVLFGECVCENHAAYNLADLGLGKNFLSQFVQAMLEFMSLGLKAEPNLK